MIAMKRSIWLNPRIWNVNAMNGSSVEQIPVNQRSLVGASPAAIDRVRKEAETTKGCFTDFSFKAFTLSLAFLGIVVKLMESSPATAFAGVFVILFCVITARIGTYKFSTANRNYAYQLHLSRLADYHNERLARSGASAEVLASLDWEELMFAWRIVEPTVFHRLYRSIPPFGLVLTDFARTMERKWFDSHLLLRDLERKCPTHPRRNRVRYEPGTYLRSMVLSLYALGVVAVGIMAYGLFLMWPSYLIGKEPFFLSGAVIAVSSFVVLCNRWLVDRSARRILQRGLGSIQARALLWRATALVLIRAKRETAEQNGRLLAAPFNGFTDAIARHAAHLARNLDHIHDWLDGRIPLEDPESGMTPSDQPNPNPVIA